MKIVNIIPHAISVPLEAPFYFSQGWVKARSSLIVEVVTEDGVIGWGKACVTDFSHHLLPLHLSSMYLNQC
ncbi:hypothetical protein JCM19233_6536 [Vibrio astriarenae]|nr:hypothetical protein JCM19233_6536 [Vibrio sp. C7]